jgi:hypothetical protein
MDSLIKVNMRDGQGRSTSPRGDWKIPVVIELGDPENFVSIRSALEAAGCLLTNWPFDEGNAMENALEVCFAACKGRALPEHARNAFLEAVSEAKLFVSSPFGSH